MRGVLWTQGAELQGFGAILSTDDDRKTSLNTRSRGSKTSGNSNINHNGTYSRNRNSNRNSTRNCNSHCNLNCNSNGNGLPFQF